MRSMQIDAAAPAVARGSIDIAASHETVWAILTDIPQWPSWNSDVKSASVQGPLSAGMTFRWKAGPGTITSVLQVVEQPRLLAWTGRTMGIKAIHVYRLDGHDKGTTVTSEESWDGIPVRLFRRSMQKSLDAGIRSALTRLKVAAERQPASG